VAVAEHTGGFGARHRRAALDAPPRWSARRVEETLHLLGHALRQAVGLAAPVLDTSAAAVAEDAGLTWLGHSRLQAALALDGGEPSARERARGLVLEEGGRWPRGLEPHHALAPQASPRKAVMATIAQMSTQETAPDPDGEPGGRRIKPHGAPDRRSSLAEKDRRHGRPSSAKTCHGFQEPWAVDVESQVTREGVVHPANEPEHAVVAWLAEA
jgi:hypothetical protein